MLEPSIKYVLNSFTCLKHDFCQSWVGHHSFPSCNRYRSLIRKPHVDGLRLRLSSHRVRSWRGRLVAEAATQRGTSRRHPRWAEVAVLLFRLAYRATQHSRLKCAARRRHRRRRCHRHRRPHRELVSRQRHDGSQGIPGVSDAFPRVGGVRLGSRPRVSLTISEY